MRAFDGADVVLLPGRGRNIARLALGGLATWPQSASTAVRAISSIGRSTVVGGFVQVAASILSNPTIENR
jgi:hypothetical protein